MTARPLPNDPERVMRRLAKSRKLVDTRRWSEACGKWGYPGMATAEKAAKITREQGDYEPGDNLRPYHCADCGAFHVGHGRRNLRAEDHGRANPKGKRR